MVFRRSAPRSEVEALLRESESLGTQLSRMAEQLDRFTEHLAAAQPKEEGGGHSEASSEPASESAR